MQIDSVLLPSYNFFHFIFYIPYSHPGPRTANRRMATLHTIRHALSFGEDDTLKVRGTHTLIRLKSEGIEGRRAFLRREPAA
mgnify:CR=1 FL=1